MPTVPDIHRRGTRDAQATIAAPPLTIGTLYFVTDEGVTERWTGSDWEPYSGAGTGVTPPPSPPGATPTTFLVSGGQAAWEAAYTFRVSAASYYIDALPYASAEQTVTLTTPHATLDRIDAIVLNTTGTVSALAGTPASTPSEPSVDPAQYLKLGIVFVTHATSAPPAVMNVLIYAEAAGTPSEWAWTASGASIVVTSTNTPHAGTKTIEGTSVVAGVYAQGTAAAALDPTNYDHLLFFLRSKAAWNSSRGLLVTLRRAGVLVGAAVEIRRSGTYGFDSTITSAYQMVAIPIVAFAVPQGATIDQVRVEDFGGAIGFYLDDVSLQAHATRPVGGGLSQDQADARYAPLVHAARHSAGAADPVTITALAGYPGGTSTFLRADGTFAAPAAGGTGDVVGPASAIDNQLTRFDGTTGKLVQASNATLDDAGVLIAAGLGGTPLNASQLTSGTVPSARLPARVGAVGLIIDGGSSAITTGVKGFLRVPFAGTITGVTLLSTDASATAGSIVVDLWKDTYATYPPTVADSICASAKPTLASANKSEDTTLTGWTTAITAGDVLGINVDSASTVTRVTLLLTVQAR